VIHNLSKWREIDQIHTKEIVGFKIYSFFFFIKKFIVPKQRSILRNHNVHCACYLVDSFKIVCPESAATPCYYIRMVGLG